MQQTYSEPDPWRSLIYLYKCVSWRLSNTAKPDANFQEFVECEEVAQWCIVALIVRSLRTEAMQICLLFASSCSIETLKHTNGCHLQTVITCSETFYGDFIKICFYKKHVCFLKFLDEVLAVCVSWDFSTIFISVSFHAKLTEYYICFSVSLGEKKQIWRAVQLSKKKYIPCEE